jgi:protein AF-17/10
LGGGGGGGPQTPPSMSISNPAPADSIVPQTNNASTIISRNDYGVITNNNNNNNHNNNTSGSTNINSSSGGNNGSTSKSIFEAAATAGGVESLSSYIGGGSTATALAATNSIGQNNGINASNNYKKKFRSSSNETPPPPPSMATSSRHTPDTIHSTATATSGGSGSFGGLKFSYESQATVTSVTGAPMATQVKDSPPSSPGSDDGGHSAKKRARKSSCSTSNTSSSLSTVTATEVKDAKLFQNGVSGHVQHMLGNQINPASNVAHKLTDQLNMEIEAHSVYNSSSLDSAQSLVGPLFPGKNPGQSVSGRSLVSLQDISNVFFSVFQLRTPAASQGPSLSAMLGGTATATAGGNTPQSLEQLLERQWEQGSQFLMEQAQHFDSKFCEFEFLKFSRIDVNFLSQSHRCCPACTNFERRM